MADISNFPALQKTLRTPGETPPAVAVLHGEEGYYIDALAKDFEALVPEADKDFNLAMLYAADTEPKQLIDICRSYPFMGGRQVVILKEAQSWGTKEFNALAPYLQRPNYDNTLVICCRGRSIAGADFLNALRNVKGAVNFESRKAKDERQLAPVVREFITSKGLKVEEKALGMLCEFVGADLSKLYNEVDKLTVSLGPGATVTPEAVEANIGISKDYNTQELVSALAARDVERVLKIYRYFRADPKNHAPQMLVAWIFPLFADVLVGLYSPDRSDRGLMEALGKKWQSQIRDVKAAMRWVGPWQAIEIIAEIRRFDAASKGNGSRRDPFDLLYDLLLRILFPLGAKGVKV